MKKLRAEVEGREHIWLEIRSAGNVGYYLFVHDRRTGGTIADYLQDTLEEALAQARDEFGVNAEDFADGEAQ